MTYVYAFLGGCVAGGAVVYIWHAVIMSKVGAVTTAVQDAKKVL